MRAASPSSSAVRARWQALAPRERQMVVGAALLVAAALVWWLLLAPAVRTLREAPAQHAQLDAQLESMQALAMEAQQLQADAAGRPSQSQAQRALQAATPLLGPSARVTLAGDRATVTLQGVPASAIAPWLAQVRSNARSVPVEAHLTRSPATPTTAPTVTSSPVVRSTLSGAPSTLAAPTPPAPTAASSLAVSPMGRAAFAPLARAQATSAPTPKPGMPVVPGAPSQPAPNANEARWDGRIVLALPAG